MSTTRNNRTRPRGARGDSDHRARDDGPSKVVINIVPTTGAPYADESALDEPNAARTRRPARNMIAFAAGT